MGSLRIAFLTPEFVTENTRLGGIAAYVYRMSTALKKLGHEPEVFTLSNDSPSLVELDSIRVERVKPRQPICLRLMRRIACRYRRCEIKRIYENLCVSLGMARAVARREKKRPFHFIHSSDFFVLHYISSFCFDLF